VVFSSPVEGIPDSRHIPVGHIFESLRCYAIDRLTEDVFFLQI